MLNKKNILIVLFIVLAQAFYGQNNNYQEENSSVKFTASNLSTVGYTMSIQDLLYSQLNSGNFISSDPGVYIYFGLNDDSTNQTAHQQIYTATVTLTVTPYSATGSLSAYDITMQIKHDYVTDGESFNDLAVYKLPGVHKASVKVKTAVVYTNNSGQTISVTSPAIYLQLKFMTDRYYNLKNTSINPINENLITYNGQTINRTSYGSATSDEDELEITWTQDTDAPAEEFELEWTWIDNYGSDNNELSENQVKLSEQDFKLNSTRVQTKNTYYRIPLVFSKGYLIYRIRPVGRFLDDTAKNYYGGWSSGINQKNTVSDWPNVIKIGANHEAGEKNWQYQSSYAEDGKKKEVVSYFDGTLRNRQTVTRINSNNQSVVGEVVYDNQGRPAIEILPVPLQESAIKFYDGLNKNLSSVPFTHKDFDWDLTTETSCSPILIDGMSTAAGASNYYSPEAITGTLTQPYQALVPDAKGYPFSQVEYTPDNTGRIKRKGGVGPDHQLGSGHEMQYYYGTPDQDELNRLFGNSVGYASHYKKNLVVDPNKQVSVSYVDSQGRTIATALAGNKPTNLDALTDESNSSLHQTITSDLIHLNSDYITGYNGPSVDGKKVNTQILVENDNSIVTFNYTLNHNTDAYSETCLEGVEYPYVFDWSFSLLNDCGTEMIIENPLQGQVGIFNANSTSPPELSLNKTFTTSGLPIGNYTLSKDLRIDVNALEAYANDYVSRISDPSNPCYIDPNDFAPNASLEDCDVTCTECEISLVTPYLSASQLTSFTNLINNGNPDGDLLGNVSLRESYINLAKQAYVLTHIKIALDNTSFAYQGTELTYTNNSGQNINPLEVDLYENRYTQEFLGLLEGCRSLCNQPIAPCQAYEYQLISDMSIDGQYGSLYGLVGESAQNETSSAEPLSIFNNSNSFYYGGYTITGTYTDPDTGELVQVIDANYSWKHPASTYLDQYGNPSKIKVKKVGDNTYEPAVVGGDLIEDYEPGYYLVSPQYIEKIEDFVSFWEPTWAKSLLPYHPEYYYFVYQKAMCESTSNGYSSDTFDSALKDIENFSDIYNGNNALGITFIQLLQRSTYNKDPFFNIVYSGIEGVIENSSEAQLRASTMDEALNNNYEGVSIGGYQLNMLQSSIYSIVNGNGMMSNADFQNLYSNTSSFSAALSYINGLNVSQQNLIWSMFRTNYIGLKEKMKTVYSHIYALKSSRYNGCIGDIDTSDFYTLFIHYQTYPQITSLIDNALNISDQDAIVDICSSQTFSLYANKAKRFLPADYGFNNGTQQGQIQEDAANDAAASIYLLTGKCPMALEMEYFLNGLTMPEYSSHGLLVDGISASSYPFIGQDFYMALAGVSTMPNLTSTPVIYGSNNGSTLAIEVSGLQPIYLTIVNANQGNTGCGEKIPNWTDYENGKFIITQLKNLYYIPGSYDSSTQTYRFRIIASIVRVPANCDVPEDIIIEGVSRVPVGGCGFEDDPSLIVPGGTVIDNQSASSSGAMYCAKRTKFEKAFTGMLNKLNDASQLFSSNIALGLTGVGSITQADPYGYVNSVMPEVFGDTDFEATWNTLSGTTFKIMLNGDSVAYLSLGQTFSSVVRFTSVNIEDDEIAITYLKYSGSVYSLVTVTGNILIGERKNSLDFDCKCTEEVRLETGADDQFLGLLSFLWNKRSTLEQPKTYIFEPYMSNIDPFLQADNPSVYNFRTVDGSGRGVFFVLDKNYPCEFYLGLDDDSNTNLFNNTVGFSDLHITDVQSGVAYFTVKVHHGEYYGYDDHNNLVLFPPGITERSGKIDCVVLECPESQTVSNAVKMLFLQLKNQYVSTGNVPDNYSSSYITTLTPYISIPEENGEESAAIHDFYLTETTSGSQMGFTLVTSGCEVKFDLPNYKISLINTVTSIEFNSDFSGFTFKGNLNNGTAYTGTGSFECLNVAPCFVEVEVSCNPCIPQTVDVVSCGENWLLFKQIVENINGYDLPDDFDAEMFCSSNLQYIVRDYQYYLSSFNITRNIEPQFVTITQFAMSALGYGNLHTQDAIDDYRGYISSGGSMSWIEYVEEIYMVENTHCPPAFIPTSGDFTIQVQDPCVMFVNNVNGTYSTELWAAYIEGQRAAFKERYIQGAMSNLVETLTKTTNDKEYQYTLYYYDQAGNLTSTVPPQGVVRLAPSQNAAINQNRDNNTGGIFPAHTLVTTYAYNSLNQLVWQKTPEYTLEDLVITDGVNGDGVTTVTRFAYDDLGRIIASQNEKQVSAHDYIGIPELTVSNGLTFNNGILIKTASGTTYLDAHSAPIITGDGYVEITNNYLTNPPQATKYPTNVRFGLSYTNSSDPSSIRYGVVLYNNGGSCAFLENTTMTTLSGVNYGDVIRITRIGNKIVYTVNGVPKKTITEPAAQAGQPLLVDIGLSNQNSCLLNLHVGKTSAERFSYTRYDELGRIYEAGEIIPQPQTNATHVFNISLEGRLLFATYRLNDFYDAPSIYTQNSIRREVTRTVYDESFSTTSSLFSNYSANNTRNRVTGVLYYDEVTSTTTEEQYQNGTFYDYDVHGNVKELIHIVNDEKLIHMGQHIKKIKYEYDLISGNVNKVIYQPGEPDQFMHRYEYDADNRITQVYTSKDNIIWEKEANYMYYEHGPLARMEVGDKQVQGLDYLYTLQGWLKAVNSESIGNQYDAGGDGLAVAKDAIAFALNYYSGDYSSRYNSAQNPIDKSIFKYSKDLLLEGTKNLYNGNIKEMATSLLDQTQTVIPGQFNSYTYDQLNRIKAMASKALKPSGSTFSPVTSYSSSYTYDNNGNLKTLRRYGINSTYTSQPLMDNFTYNYYPGTNKLMYVRESNTASTAFDGDIDAEDQMMYNYGYDAIGQLVTDAGEGLSIDWRVDGKVSTITKADGTVIKFEYDGLGNRLAKTVAEASGDKVKTYYVRDAQGNVLSVYEVVTPNGEAAKYYLVEQDIYGSSRIGMEQNRIELAQETMLLGLSEGAGMSMMTAMTQTYTMSAPEALYGLNLSQPSYTIWTPEETPKLNFFEEYGSKTRDVEIKAHFKIDENDFANMSTRNLTDLQGVTAPWPTDWWTRSGIKVQITRDQEGYFRPVIVLEKYHRDVNHYRRRLSWRWSFWNTINQKIYTLEEGIPTGEWDMDIKLTLNNNNYDIVLMLNGNEYIFKNYPGATPNDFTESLVTFDGKEYTGLKDAPVHPVAKHSIGKRRIDYHEELVFEPYPAVKMQLCDFHYAFDGQWQKFEFDDASAPNISVSEEELQMQLYLAPYVASYCGLPDQDSDSDGKTDDIDNCVFMYNPDQADGDGDGVGDECDNCKYLSNSDQADNDGDNIGNLCDNCPDVANYNQVDSDGDGIGDLCDNCVYTYNPNQADANNDGIGDVCQGQDQGVGTPVAITGRISSKRFVGDKRYELTNHLGNVLSVVSDRKLSLGSYFVPDVISYSDYYPFGMQMPNRFYNGTDYRYGFQGQEKDNEIKGEGNSYNYTFRMHDPRIGRFFAVDPLTKEYPHYTPYSFSGNKVIHMVELEGLEEVSYEYKDKVRNLAKSRLEVASANMSEDEYEDIEEALRKWKNVTNMNRNIGREITEYMLYRYVEGRGGYDIVDMTKVPTRNPLKYISEDLNARIMEEAGNLKPGNHRLIFETRLPRSQSAAYTYDLGTAYGSYETLGRGIFDINVSEDGSYTFSGDIYYTFRDNYRWHTGRFSVLSLAPGLPNHKEMELLKKIGAKDFSIRAYYQTTVKGSSSQRKMTQSSPLNSINTHRHLKETKSYYDFMEENPNLIEDFRNPETSCKF